MSKIIGILDGLLQAKRPQIEEWLGAQRDKAQPSIYSSVDLRHSGHKLAPVDTNLYPAGFNNLSPAARTRSMRNLRDRFDAMKNPPERILIVPENHTRNLGYLENLAVLAEIVALTGRDVRIGTLASEENISLQTLTERSITEHALVQKDGRLVTRDGFDPEFILLNNDCTSGFPEMLRGIAQPIQPSPELGWYRRRKSEHARVYDKLAEEFGREFGIDPWLITATSHRCGIVDFKESKGIECVALGVERVLHHTRGKYAEHGINETPYVFIKADSGTYGMGIMTVQGGEELMELNKKIRNKMNVIKEGTQNTEVIVQEGIPTIDRAEDAVAEPMLYLVDGVPVGGAYRINTERDALSNLNAAGMRFAGMCDQAECGEQGKNRVAISDCNFCVFGLVATLSTLATSRETYDSLDIGFSI